MSREVAAPSRTDDPDTPTEAFGSWRPIDLGRLGLTPLGWLFVGGALFVALAHLRSIDGAPIDVVPDIVLAAIEAAVVVLVPAALLWRAPEAVRTHRLLLAGLVLAATAQLILGVYQLWPFIRGDAETRSVFDTAWPWLTPLGGVLVGLGLLQLLTGPTRLPVLAAIVVIYVGLGVASFAIGSGSGTVDLYNASLMVIGPAAAAVAVWVPVVAWLEIEAPRTFWTLLAVALPLGIVSRLLMLLATIVASSMQSNALFLPTMTTTAFLGASVGLLALVAYARLTPVDEAR